ncbi:uncharacterized protein LOC114533564 isoform X4 [Dendronephthya gigantea]|uniref:uncharacterized protein LOC114533564 isoform X4 n=1 Tax=Dendronephthya gigantea TaxID=151771 RepID=UPI00106C74DC|nr:uncharacterized protein LOC114533564 isoform X4 [Dendronephthya gigantea]
MLCLVVCLTLLNSYADALPPEPYVLYSNITNLHILDLNTLTRTNVLGGLDRAIPIGIDTKLKHIYFGEHTLGLIYRVNYDGTSKTLIMKDVVNVEGVAIDWIGRKIYWTSYQSGTIEVATLNGNFRKVLLNTGLEYPRGMAVDPIAGYLFWSDWGAKAAVERCDLDGTNRVVLVKDNITWPNGVTLDTSARLVYWIDAYHDKISSIDYDGNNRRIIFEDKSLALSQFHGFDLDITGDSIYYTDWLTNSINGININTGVMFVNITVPTTNWIKGAMGLRVIDSSKQKDVSNSCGGNNGGCQQLCFNKIPSGTSCACQLGFKLANDNKSCEDAFKDEFLMFADADAGKIYQMQLDSVNVKPIALPFDENTNITRPVALEYDWVEDRVYWTDVTLRIICRAFRNGTGFEVLFNDIGVEDGLTIDLAGRQLYWTSTTYNTVETSKLDGSFRKTLVKSNLDEPRDIIVDPIDGYMYWTDWGSFSRIERAYMNGENRMDLVNRTLHWPNGLTIDHVYNKLYWVDAGEDNIEAMDLDTLKRKVVLNQKILLFGFLFRLTTEVNHPYGLTALNDHLYWTDWNTDSVYRGDVNTAANIKVMATNLGKPMDIHAYSSIPKQQKRLHYTFSFPQHGSNFTCILFQSCPVINAPPSCPSGYSHVRENSTCGLNCRDIVGYTWRCPCNDWMSCAVKERYLWGCAYGYYSSFRVRECVQDVKAGRCPYGGGKGTSCVSDSDCPSNDKCCDSKCATPATIAAHPCQTNNGGCDQLCFGIPGGHKCGCKNGYSYDKTQSKCVHSTRPANVTVKPPPGKSCKPHPAPKHGSVTCDTVGGYVPEYKGCKFSCDSGYRLIGWSWDLCINGVWIVYAPTCKIDTRPKLSHCPNDTTIPTDPGKSYATFHWVVPTATDYNGTNLPVNIYPYGYSSPVNLSIGWHRIDVSATNKNGEYVRCYFSVSVEDREPPSFGSTCPSNIQLYTDKNDSIRLPSSFKKPTATDNVKPPSVHSSGFPSDSFFPIGTTVVKYTATDDAGLNATCIFSVTVVNVCNGATCTHGSKCVLNPATKSSYMCSCKFFCSQHYDPVCGSDGRDYNNECLLNATVCTSRKTVTVVKKGKCADDALPSEPYLVYSNITNLHILDLNTLARTNVLGGLDRAIPIGIDTKQKHIYFGENTLGLIYRVNYDGTNKTLIMKDVVNVEGVAIDWIGRKIYWTTYKSGTIEVATLDGKFRKVLLNTGLEYPRGMAVDPIAGHLFWSDWGAKAAVERCDLDGTNRVALVKDNITWPNGVTLDTSARLVYWIDAFHDKISSIDYDGNNRRITFEDKSLALSQFHGFDLDITGDSIYYTDWLTNSINGININTGVMFVNITIPTTNLFKGAMGLRVIDSSKQKDGTTNCGSSNGGCEELCFHKVPSGTSCACQLGQKLANDKKTCEDPFKEEFIMFADADAGKIYEMQLDSVNVKPIAIPFDENTNITRPVALEYDWVEDRVYWTDVTLRIICRAFRNGTGFEVLFNDIGVADGLTIDLAGRQLYWTSTTNNTVETSKLDGSFRKTLVKSNLDEPRDIIVDPIDGYMYWTDWGSFSRIERAYMNGENRMDLVNRTLHWPNGLTIDHVYNKLYWVDAGEDNIEAMDLDTYERKVVLNKKFLLFGILFRLTTEVNHPYGLTSLYDHLYWTDWNTDSVYRGDVNTAANIRVMATNLGKPMDIHAYSSIPKQQKRLHYTFSFPKRGSNFTCISSRSCPVINAPPSCPPGYSHVRENSTCGLYCRDIVGYTWRCPCNDWMSCAVKERYLWGCAYGYYSSFRVRECVQDVKAGRCPYGGGKGTSCVSDSDCPSNDKCCDSKCATPATIAAHPCQTNNGGCDQLCFGIPGGHKCGCKNGYSYDKTQSKCVHSTRPANVTVKPPPGKSCKPHPAPKHGSVTCDTVGGYVPEHKKCNFSCDSGYRLIGRGWDICIKGVWIDDTPTCIIDTRPKLSHCPNDVTVPTNPGESFTTVYWDIPTATDYNGTSLPVDIYPFGYSPPVNLSIGWHSIYLTATDKNGESTYCYFSVTVEDMEPPSFGSTCPSNIQLYTDKNDSIHLPSSFKKPTATDNAKPPSVHSSGFPANSFFPIGTTVVKYTATDDAGLNATCIFSVTVVNVCNGATCTHGSKCVLNPATKSSYMCSCTFFCPQHYDPVCGSDGRDYNNECLLNATVCTLRKTVTVVKKGKCEDACDKKKCTHGAICRVRNGKAECSCDLSCSDTLDPVCGSDGKNYENRCKMNETACNEKNIITMLKRGKCVDCSTVKCGFGAQCVVEGGKAKCECNFTCADSNNPVCGSDGRTYKNKCELQNKQCAGRRNITVIKNEPCGCDDLNSTDAESFTNSSTMQCQDKDNSVQCEVKCKSGYNAVFNNFLKLQCYEKQWIRGNNAGAYVVLADVNSPPTCYEPTPKQSHSPYCPSGSAIYKDVCVECPRGSYLDQNKTKCEPCPVTEYQDSAGQTSCKKCKSTKTSTATGAENCFFDHSNSVVEMVFAVKPSKVSKDKVQSGIAKALTNVCKTETCSFNKSTTGRNKRASDTYKFEAKHVIIMSQKPKAKEEGQNTAVYFLVLDPKSTSLLPDQAFSSKNLKYLIEKIQKGDLPYPVSGTETVPPTTLTSISDTPTTVRSAVRPTAASSQPSPSINNVDNEASTGEKSTSKVPVIAGVVVAVVVLIFLVFAFWMYRRRKNKSTIPPVQFNSANEDRTQIGDGRQSEQNQSNTYDTPAIQLSFLNKVFSDIHGPPPSYSERSSEDQSTSNGLARPHVYKIPDDDQADPLPAKEKLPGDAVVDMIPEQQDEIKNQKSPEVVSFPKRTAVSNIYEVPNMRSFQRTPDAQPQLRLQPPPKSDYAFRDQAASSILPNVPRKSKANVALTDANENTNHQGRSVYQNVGDVTREQSET